MGKVIAIDGPSGAGKSTMAKLVAGKLGFDYLDTGALYRAVGLGLVGHGLDEEASDEEISEALKQMNVEFASGRVFLNRADVSEKIRSPEAGHYASVFSARLPVRRHLLDIQRDAGKGSDLVAEGRDMTTVVFPRAFKKIYLDAAAEERAKRRTAELRAKGLVIDAEETLREIIERDARDSDREIAPLKRAEDAAYIDSTGLLKEEVLDLILKVIKGHD